MRVLNGFNVLILNNPLFFVNYCFSLLFVPYPIYKDKTQVK